MPFYFSNPQVLFDTRRRTLYVAYPAGGADGKWDILLAVSTNGGQSFVHRKINDDASCANHMTLTLALEARTGKIHLMWAENRDGQARMVTSVCAIGGAICAVNEALSDPFAAYKILILNPYR